MLTPPAGSAAPLLYSAAQGLTKDDAGNVYFVDSNIQGVRKVTPAGAATTLLRRVTAGIVTTLNTTSANSLAYASHITVDAAGNIYATNADHTVTKGVPSFAGELESRLADVSLRDVP